MTTTKDLVEAHAFTRRRLVAAFLSGAPGGREAEPARPGRAILGGAGLALLLVAGVAVASLLSPDAPGGRDGAGAHQSETRSTLRAWTTATPSSA